MTNEEKYELFRDNIDIFAQVFCEHIVSEDVPAFHEEMYELLANDRVTIAAPRGFAKSTLVAKIYPLHQALFKLKKDICIISASEDLAVEHVRYIKMEIESNPAIIGCFGDLKSDKWTETHLVIAHPDGTRITIRAKGAGGQIRGYRPDCIIVDDLEKDEAVLSEDQRRKLKEWFFRACINCLLPGGQLVVIGTILHPLSFLNDLLESPNNYVKKKYQAYIDGVEEEGHELWASHRPHEWLQKRKSEIGTAQFSSEYMNNPLSDEMAVIKSNLIRYWTELPTQLGMVIAVDPAYSEDEKADWKVAVLVGTDQNNNRYLIDYIRTHSPTGEFMDSILNLWIQHKNYITALGIPNAGVEKEFYNGFLKRANERGLYPPLQPLKNAFTSNTGGTVRNKKSRITAALQPLFEQGKYYIHENHIQAREELLTIGNSRWDDVVDALTYAEQLATPLYYEIQKETKYKYNELVGNVSDYGIEY